MPRSFPSSASGRWAGQEPMPSFQAASIMFCAQRPASNACSVVWTSTTIAAAPASQRPCRLIRPSAARRSGSRITMKRFGSRFLELPVMRPAWRMRPRASSGTGFGKKARWSRLATMARYVSTPRPAPRGRALERARRQRELEEPRRVLAEHARPLPVVETPHRALDGLGRVGPRPFVMGIVVAPHDAIDQPVALRQLEPRRILLERGESAGAEVLARQHLQLGAHPEVVLSIVLVHRGEEPGQPADSGLDGGDEETGEAV